MNSRFRLSLFVSLGIASWLSLGPVEAQAQRPYIVNRIGNPYFGSPYGGYGVYAYQPQYYAAYSYQPQNYIVYGYQPQNYGGYSYQPQYDGYNSSSYSYSNNGTIYQSNYPTIGYNGGSSYGSYPTYTTGYRGVYYGY